MQRITDQAHDKYTFLYASSKLLERTAYYGVRSLMVIYMVGEGLEMPRTEALEIYGWFTALLLISTMVGALIGDLVLGSKRAFTIGILLQAFGAFAIGMDTSNGLYIGLSLIVLGGGLHKQNMSAFFGKLYYHKKKLLESAFSISYLAANIGALIGVSAIGYIGMTYGFQYGFIASGVVFVTAAIIPILSRESIEIKQNNAGLTNQKRVVIIILSAILLGVFWASYEISYSKIFVFQNLFNASRDWEIPYSFWSGMSSIGFIPIALILIFVWTFFQYSRTLKLICGFLCAAGSFAILYMIPEAASANVFALFIASYILFSIAELHISPVIYSIITKYSNTKYLAIIFSLAYVPTGLLNKVLTSMDFVFELPNLAVSLGLIFCSLLAVVLLVYLFIEKHSAAK